MSDRARLKAIDIIRVATRHGISRQEAQPIARGLKLLDATETARTVADLKAVLREIIKDHYPPEPLEEEHG